MMTWSEAHQMMQTARNGRRKLARNTYLHAAPGPDREGNDRAKGTDYAVRYHGTDVVIMHEDGTFTLNTGGWRTFTTKDRINRFSPARVHAESGLWLVSSKDDPVTPARVQQCRKCHGTRYVTDRGYSYRDYSARDEHGARPEWEDLPVITVPDNTHQCYRCDGQGRRDYGSKPNPVRFFDGITVQETGKPIGRNLKRQHDTTRDDKFNKSMRAKIKRYVDGYTDDKIAELVKAAAENGTAGDCWFCSMFDWEGTRGEANAGYRGSQRQVAPSNRDNSHLAEHVKEDYRMASLMHNAVAAKGYRWPVVILQTQPQMTRDAIGEYMRKRLLRNVDTR